MRRIVTGAAIFSNYGDGFRDYLFVHESAARGASIHGREQQAARRRRLRDGRSRRATFVALEGVADVGEGGAEAGANDSDGADDHHSDKRGDETVFDGRRAIVVAEHPRKDRDHDTTPREEREALAISHPVELTRM